jgi:Kae1-associated kinase Bud32
MRSEVRIIEKLISNGVPVPSLYSVDTANSQIIMELIEGVTLEQALRSKDFKNNLVGTAELLASIHSLGVIHGDPTTSNFIVNKKIHAIDFGLAGISEDDEARASDLRVLLESLDSHHSEISGRDIFLEAYSEWSNSAPVLEALKVLELRGRYNLMRG